MICKVGDKYGYKFGENGFCYTYNQNEKSKLKAFELAKKNESWHTKQKNSKNKH